MVAFTPRAFSVKLFFNLFCDVFFAGSKKDIYKWFRYFPSLGWGRSCISCK